MSLILIAEVLKMKLGNPLRKLVLLKLADNANDKGQCWPSHAYIAEYCEMSKRSVINHINGLEADNYLTVVHRVKDNKKQSNVYQLHFEKAQVELVVKPKDLEADAINLLIKSQVGSESPAPLSGEANAQPSATDSLPSSAVGSHRTSNSSEPVNELNIKIREVYDHWLLVFPNKSACKYTDSKKKFIRGRLKEGFSVDELKQAIDGCAGSEWHMGLTPSNSTVYDGIENIFRNAEKTEGLIKRSKSQGEQHAGIIQSQKPAQVFSAANVFRAGNESIY